MINGAYPQNLPEIGKEIKQSILGAYFNAGKKVDPFEGLDFEINTAGSKLVFAKSAASSLIYNVDGKLPTQSTDRTSLIIAKSFSQMQVDDKKNFSMNRIKQIYPEIKIDSVNELQINGISGYEISGDLISKTSDQGEKIYQVILFTDDIYYIVIGTANDDFANNLQTFRSVTKTFRRK
jgi:hypothetical protein